MWRLRLLRIRAFAAGNATAFLMSGAIFAAGFFVAQYFQFALGYSPLATGARLLPWFATPMLVSPVAGALSARVGRRPAIASRPLVQSPAARGPCAGAGAAGARPCAGRAGPRGGAPPARGAPRGHGPRVAAHGVGPGPRCSARGDGTGGGRGGSSPRASTVSGASG